MIQKGQRWVAHGDAAAVDAGSGVTRRLLTWNDSIMCVEYTFEKGAQFKPHSHPHTQFTYVVSGVFSFTIGGETRTIRAGDILLKEDGVEHSNVCLEAGVLLEIFSPIREDLL